MRISDKLGRLDINLSGLEIKVVLNAAIDYFTLYSGLTRNRFVIDLKSNFVFDFSQ